MGIPSEPGGSLFNDLLPFVKRRKIGMRNRKIARKILMIYVWLWFFEVVEGGDEKPRLILGRDCKTF
jgi:hypothetical protein